ncbi:hypothetical protein YPPY72_2963, partial [Yersinia pestis PY-72]|jgi:copper chaperone CopZ
MLMA